MKKIYFIFIILILFLTGCRNTDMKDNNVLPDKTVSVSETDTEAAETVIDETTAAVETIAAETVSEEETTAEEPVTEGETQSLSAKRDEYYTGLVEQAKAEGRKIVYLTFDDGSAFLTPTVLDILDEYNVKATFFVVGSYSPNEEFAKTEYNDIINRGHTLGIHSFTHSRANIYASIENFSSDCDRMIEYVTNLTGYTPFLWRFPGGSATSFADSRMITEYIPYIESKGLIYYDWNVSSGDGSEATKADAVYQNVIDGVKKKDVSVVLMHDGSGHEETVAALPGILDTLINELNCLVVPITESTVPVQAQIG